MSSLRNYETVDVGKFIMVTLGRELINATRHDPLEFVNTLAELEDELDAQFVCAIPNIMPVFLMRKTEYSVLKTFIEDPKETS
jgi:hypothetical protein